MTRVTISDMEGLAFLVPLWIGAICGAMALSVYMITCAINAAHHQINEIRNRRHAVLRDRQQSIDKILGGR